MEAENIAGRDVIKNLLVQIGVDSELELEKILRERLFTEGVHKNRDDVEQWVALYRARGKKPDLTNAKLAGLLLDGIDLRRVDLRRADLREADLRGVKLNGADLSRTNLDGANLRGANLRRTVLDDDTRLDVKWRMVWKIVNRYGWPRDLRGADLRGADLCRADLSWTDLSGANLCEANLREADLRKADMSGASLDGANLLGANLSGANLRGANLWEVTMPNGEICTDIIDLAQFGAKGTPDCMPF